MSGPLWLFLHVTVKGMTLSWTNIHLKRRKDLNWFYTNNPGILWCNVIHNPRQKPLGVTLLSLPPQYRSIYETLSANDVSVLSCSCWYQLGLLAGTVPVPAVHHLSSPAFSLLWASLPALWLRINSHRCGAHHWCPWHSLAQSQWRFLPTDPNACQSHRQGNEGKAKGCGWLPVSKSFIHPPLLPSLQAQLG